MSTPELVQTIYHKHYKYFYVVAYNLCKRHDMREDIIQEGFIKLLTCKVDFLDVAHARRYLTGCIRNAAFERLGKEQRIRAMRKDAIMSYEEQDAPLSIQFSALLSKIKSEMKRKIIQEIYFYSKTKGQLASEYHLNKKTISNYEKSALSELKKLIPQFS